MRSTLTRSTCHEINLSRDQLFCGMGQEHHGATPKRFDHVEVL